MLAIGDAIAPRTTTDIVFDQLHAEISSLQLLPGTRISEAEIAERIGVSRQPVRDAFNRLNNLGLLSIRPQRATVVCGFSKQKIANARFIRLAIELEVIRNACRIWDEKSTAALKKNIKSQHMAIRAKEIETFHELDYEFHQLICALSGHPLAFRTIVECKQQVDRLCVLSLARTEEVEAVLEGHEEIALALEKKSVANAEKLIRRHLSRLDDAIREIEETHSEYFE